MIPVEQALEYVLATARPRPPEEVSLADAVGRVLQEALVADRDFPSGHRATMDGIALSYASWAKGCRSFPIQEMQVAGAPPVKLRDAAACIEIMTGAMLDNSADTVIRYEDLHIEAQGGQRIAHVQTEAIRDRQNVQRRASDSRAGDLLLTPGALVGASEIGIAASVGKARLLVAGTPRIAVISTGDELVDVADTPLPYQIRRSNSYSLQAALREMHILSADLYHLPDARELIYQELKRLLQSYDTLILSGGVSMGKADFIPEVLADLGLTCLFHKVAQRPGKPLWFGVQGEKTVFGLPGNPVSTFVSFHRYIKPWLLKCLNQAERPLPLAVLGADVAFAPALTYFMQVSVRSDAQGRLLATPEQGHGSGDHGNLLRCDGFLQLPPGPARFAAGEVFPLLLYRGM